MIALMLFGGLALYLTIAVIATRSLVRQATSKRTKWLLGLASALLFFLIPTWDVIAGKIYLRYLCATESGVKIYKTAELGPDYWFPDGKPRFITSDGLADQKLLGARYEFSSKSQENYSVLFHIKKNTEVVSEKQTGATLAEYIRFIHFGGWFANSTGLHVRGTGCPTIEEYDYRGFLKQVFRPLSTKK